MRTTRKLLALLLAVAMVFTMTAMTALATGGDDGTTTPGSGSGTTTPDGPTPAGDPTAPDDGDLTAPGGDDGTTTPGGPTAPGGDDAPGGGTTSDGDPTTPEVSAEAQTVINLIADLPTSENIQAAVEADTFDLEAFKAQVFAAQVAYDALSDAEKTSVGDISRLTQAVETLAQLESISPLGAGDVCQIEGGGQFASLKDSEDDAFQVITSDGTIFGEYKTVKDARSAMQDGYTLKLLKDYVSTEEYNYGISIDKRNITIDLNGYSVTSNNTNAPNGYAIKLEQTNRGAYDNTVTIRNSGSRQSVLSSSNYQVTTKSGNSNINQVVKFEGDIVFRDIDGSKPLGIKLGTGAKLLDTDSARTLIPNGGFSVKETDGSSYIYGNLANAAGRSADGNITLLHDYAGSDQIASGQKNGTLNLNGHTYTYTGSNAAIDVNYPNVTLTVKNGSVVVTDESADGAVLVGAPDTDNMNSRGLVLDNVQLTVPGNAYGIVTNGTETDNTVTLKNNSVLNVKDGYGIYFPSDGEVIIDNSTINAKHVGVQLCAGDLTVTGESAITVTGQPQEKTEDDGPVADGAAVSIIKRDGYRELGTVKIESGDFNAAADVTAVKAYSFNNTEKTEGEWAEAGNFVRVTGGTFSSDVTRYVVAGATVKQDDNGNYVVGDAAAVAKIGDETYSSLADALKAANPNGTVTLLKNITVKEWNQAWNLQGITLDGGGKTIKVKAIASLQNHDAVFHSAGGNTFKDLTVDLSGINQPSEAQGNRAFAAAAGDTFRNVTIIGSDEVSYGITISGTNDSNETVTIEGCTIENCAYAIYDSETGEVENLIIKDSTISGCDYATILHSPYGQFTNNQVTDGKLNIMEENQTITGNTFDGASRIKFYDAPKEFKRNKISDNSQLDKDDDLTDTIDVSENYWGGGAPTKGQVGKMDGKVTGTGVFYVKDTMHRPQDLNTYTPPSGGSGSYRPVILSPSWSQTVSVVEHGTLTMSVLARGASSYQWYVDRGDGRFVAIAGATGPSLTIWPDMGDHGNRYYCQAMNGYGWVNSPYFTLCVVRSTLPPKTGDQVCVTLWVCLMALGVAGVLAARNRQRNR